MTLRIGMVAYSTHQGLGYLAKSFYDAGVIDDVLVVPHRAYPNHPEWYGEYATIVNPRSIRGTEVDRVLSSVDTMLFFETPFDWSFPERCHSHGVKTVCIPMYEWFPKNRLSTFSGYLCPSRLDVDYFCEYRHTPFVPPVDPASWSLRTRAVKFLHNSGHIGHRNHKGTEELLQSLQYLETDLVVTVRSQSSKTFNNFLQKMPWLKDNRHLDLQLGEVPYKEMFSGHDVYVAPEKFNGLSLPLQESYSSGLLVMASDRYPTNTWLPTEPLIPVKSYYKAAIADQYISFDEAQIDPKSIASKMDQWYGQDITAFSYAGREWAKVNSWNNKRDTFFRLMEGLCE